MIQENDRKRDTEKISVLYNQRFGHEPCSVEPLAGGGGARHYYALTGAEGRSVLGVAGPDKEENASFLSLAGLIKGAPEIYCADVSQGIYILEDFGRESLLDRVTRNPFRIHEIGDLLGDLMELLVSVQTDTAVIAHVRHIGHRFSEALIRHDLEYFRSQFLERTPVKYNEGALLSDFHAMERNVMSLSKTLWGFMYRDFQGRNVHIKPDNTFGLIDFQAGMEGPCVYDVASLLWQAKAHYTPRMKQAVMNRYATAFSAHRKDISAGEVALAVEKIAPLRILQTLGAYGKRGLGEGKKHFLESIASGVENLREAADTGMLTDYPELTRVAEALASHFSKSDSEDRDDHTQPLTVTVESFSYRVGYPEDTSGNGGGFIFDCRWMHNPGRYDTYKHLTGMDEPVIDFLEDQGEIQEFVDRAEAIVVPAIDKYIKRGFSSLYIGFGCTGGQHRSVYSAQELAARLRNRFTDIHITLRHTRQGIIQSV